jgi:hypothetical protein
VSGRLFAPGPVLVALVLAALYAACGAEPRVEVASSRQAVLEAIRLVRGHSPERAARLERALGEAELATVRAGREGAGAVAAVWGEVLASAWQELGLVMAEQEEAEVRWRELEPRVAEAVERASAERRQPGMGSEAAAASALARTRLETARRLWQEGEREAALRAATAALAETDAVGDRWQGLRERFDDPELVATWRRWVEDTVDRSRRSRGRAIVVDKLARRLEVFSSGQPVASFAIELGANGLAQKVHAGDRATPEGVYRVTAVKSGGQTKYYRALLLDYPNDADRRRHREAARAGRVPEGAGPGSLIEVHGDGGRGQDWTDGCVALTNDDMDRLVGYVRVGTPVVIVGRYFDARDAAGVEQPPAGTPRPGGEP